MNYHFLSSIHQPFSYYTNICSILSLFVKVTRKTQPGVVLFLPPETSFLLFLKKYTKTNIAFSLALANSLQPLSQFFTKAPAKSGILGHKNVKTNPGGTD